MNDKTKRTSGNDEVGNRDTDEKRKCEETDRKRDGRTEEMVERRAERQTERVEHRRKGIDRLVYRWMTPTSDGWKK